MFPFEDQLRQTLNQLLLGFAGAIEYWTVACLSQGDLGDPREFVDTQWASLMNEVHETRVLIAKWPHEPPEVVHEQLTGLMTACSDLREIFETFLQAPECGPEPTEAAVSGLGRVWREVRLRVSLMTAMLPLHAPLPGISLEKEAYYQRILDELFDRFESMANDTPGLSRTLPPVRLPG